MQDEPNLHGKEIVQKHINFLSALKEIEERHIDYFRARPGKFIDNDHDYLHNHYNTRIFNGVVSFGFIADSGIDKEIERECLEAYKKHHQS